MSIHVADLGAASATAWPQAYPPDVRDAVPPGVLAVVTDPCGVVTWCSDAVGVLFGRSCTSLVGQPFPLDVFERDQLERRASAARVPVGPALLRLDPRRFDRRSGTAPRLGSLDRRRPGGPDRSTARAGEDSCTWNVEGANGAKLVVSLTVWPFLDGAGRTLGYVGQAVDVTEAQKTNTLLAQALVREQEATRRLAELDQLRNDFVATAGHELRTPLTSILGFVELLEDDVAEPATRVQFANAIRRNVARLQDLAAGLLILPAADSHRADEHELVDLRDVVVDVRTYLLGLGEAHGVMLDLCTPEQPVEVLGDAARLRLVVVNLVENGLKFTPPGGRVGCRVTVDSTGEVTIEVSDSGPGIPDSDLPHLFSPFFRGAAALEGAVPGSGLGLSIVAAVVAEHEGLIRVSAAEPQGTVFTVNLPAVTR